MGLVWYFDPIGCRIWKLVFNIQRCQMLKCIEVDYFVGIPENCRKWEDIHHAAPSSKSHPRYYGHHAAAKLPESRAPVVA